MSPRGRGRARRLERKYQAAEPCEGCGHVAGVEPVYEYEISIRCLPPPHVCEWLEIHNPKALAEMRAEEAKLPPEPEPEPPCSTCGRPRSVVIEARNDWPMFSNPTDD